MAPLRHRVRDWLQRGPVPLRFIQEARGEVHLAGIRLRGRLDPRWRRRARGLRQRTDVKLHFGCGRRILPGWVNVDGWSAPDIDHVIDLRQRLPLADASCELIFTEHVLEHIEPQYRPGVFREFHRVMKPGARLRVVVPNCARYAEAYARADVDWFEKASPGARTMAEGVNDVFMNHFHRFIDDFQSLSRSLAEAGFTDIIECSHNGSSLAELRLDSAREERELLNLYVEASK